MEVSRSADDLCRPLLRWRVAVQLACRTWWPGCRAVRFPTPFAKPPGRGESAPVVNFIWGAVNLAAGVALLVRFPLSLGLNFETLTLAVGALLLGLSLSLHFGGVRGAK